MIRRAAGAVGAVALITAVVVIVGWREATSVPRVVQYDVTVADWPAGQPPLRVVQLSDTHQGPPDMPPKRLDAIVDQVNALMPDLVVMTGDYHAGKLVDQGAGNLDTATKPFSRLRSRLGTFAVRGNHDVAYWSRKVIPRYRMTYLENSWADAGPVIVAGLDDLTTGRPDIARALAGIPPAKPVIVLMHEPASFDDMPARVAVAFAGHTHGGQIKLPLIGAPWLPYGSGRYLRGAYPHDGRVLIVSSGVGTTGLPVRLGVPPEIVLATLHGE